MTDEAEYREKGAKAYRDGVPYSHCPYLPFPDCVEGVAWKNGWLAEKEKSKPKQLKEPPRGRERLGSR